MSPGEYCRNQTSGSVRPARPIPRRRATRSSRGGTPRDRPAACRCCHHCGSRARCANRASSPGRPQRRGDSFLPQDGLRHPLPARTRDGSRRPRARDMGTKRAPRRAGLQVLEPARLELPLLDPQATGKERVAAGNGHSRKNWGGLGTQVLVDAGARFVPPSPSTLFLRHDRRLGSSGCRRSRCGGRRGRGDGD
jgi:hypothetical protein